MTGESDAEVHKNSTRETRYDQENIIPHDTILINCTMCHKGFTSEQAMNNHKILVHAEVRRMSEAEEFLQASNHKLESMLEYMVERRDGKWICNKCGKQQRYKFNVKKHAETHIEGIVHSCKLVKKLIRQEIP